MRIWILSDVHDEVYSWAPPSIPDADICIVAGDIGRAAQEHADWVAYYIRPHMPCVSVLGNHEFYGSWLNRERSEAQWQSRKHDIHILDDMTWTEGGVRFVGATLWTDFYLRPDPEDVRDSVQTAALQMRDYSQIHVEDRKFTPAYTAEMHATSIQFIVDTLETPFDGETVVVTHHSPSPRSISEHYSGDPLNAAFHSNLDALIEKYQPALWVHGHTHDSCDYQIGRTRVICNPKGYGMENWDRFDPALVVEIGEPKPKPPGM